MSNENNISSSNMYWAASTKGFYDPSINTFIPSDAVEITRVYWQELLTEQSEGKTIESDGKGYPIAIFVPLTKEQTIEIINVSVQGALDSGAQSWGYSSIVAGASYYGCNTPQYAADAVALMDWRDSVWQWAYAKYPSVTPGETPAEFMVDMPTQPPKPVV
jgi:hypothetical protein